VRILRASIATILVATCATTAVLGEGNVGADTTAERIDQAFDLAYNLDHDKAVALLEQAIREDAGSIAAPRALATIVWLNLLFRRGMVLVEHYLGPVSRQDVKLPAPPAETAQVFRRNVDRAIGLAEARVARTPNDPTALYELGTALGLQASWAATVEGRVLGAFGSARRAYNLHEKVLALAPQREEAGLIVGTYRYLVSSLVLPARWIAYMAGFGGGRERGLSLIEAAARPSSPAQADARFALVLLYNRERQYDRALVHLAELQRRYPRNRLLWLEAGATYLRANRPADAERVLSEGLKMLAADPRIRMRGEEGHWFYKRGAARVLLKRPTEAAADLDEALGRELQAWVRGRVHLERGKAADLAGDRARATREYGQCERLCAAAGDDEATGIARRLRTSAYRGT
jgi:tetratricopeptide (TPR) repeat protein